MVDSAENSSQANIENTNVNQEVVNEGVGVTEVLVNEATVVAADESDNKEIPRIYIGNLDYSATEDELFNFLKEYEVVSVIVPSHTVRGFLSSHVRPLGIAYADFNTVEKAKEVVEALSNKKFKNRKIKVKLYKPFKPDNLLKPKKKVSGGKQRRLTVLRRYKQDDNEENKKKGSEEDDVSKKSYKVTQPTSIDTVYCGYLPKNTTDTDLREHFKGYNPQEIWIFRTRTTKGPRHLQIHRHYTAALITLSTTEPIDKISEVSSEKKLLNKTITVKPAYLSKIQEVRRIAEQNGLVEPPENDNQPEQQETVAVTDEQQVVPAAQENTNLSEIAVN
ncbi:hypothetical protein TPHA_0C04450 [Tetrapisispora phaffii CBS 4417]|uniref:Regulator of rDNA transcription protein 5 n=1 Tax=Tetrapisispora phaffii (strain ATCC 24235 / CBS 4417 / NBRC 1672 / NRRL Y-8282 / UCD 70-5) TaxID=1071381 RepID=G8BQT4_TETPH|nr:hypothetical protein TPHA_0C04450 [Tetrapisispora phaffii CBS 4417]CCE62596.1 hypothetical protein TPHA_0C04450 [Tetrapisispora phaffii CBS 4417]